VEFVKQDVATIRTGRAVPALVENVVINAYGGSQNFKVVELGRLPPRCPVIGNYPYDNSIIGDIGGIWWRKFGLTPIIDKRHPDSRAAAYRRRRMEYVKMLAPQTGGRAGEGTADPGTTRWGFEAAHSRLTHSRRRRFTLEENYKDHDEMMEKIESAASAKQINEHLSRYSVFQGVVNLDLMVYIQRCDHK